MNKYRYTGVNGWNGKWYSYDVHAEGHEQALTVTAVPVYNTSTVDKNIIELYLVELYSSTHIAYRWCNTAARSAATCNRIAALLQLQYVEAKLFAGGFLGIKANGNDTSLPWSVLLLTNLVQEVTVVDRNRCRPLRSIQHPQLENIEKRGLFSLRSFLMRVQQLIHSDLVIVLNATDHTYCTRMSVV